MLRHSAQLLIPALAGLAPPRLDDDLPVLDLQLDLVFYVALVEDRLGNPDPFRVAIRTMFICIADPFALVIMMKSHVAFNGRAA